jgi:peptidoglycan/LPS O-acetylase OafA/YrhL
VKYRSEIDGLRALAVLPVILFHAGFENFSGGYIGAGYFGNKLEEFFLKNEAH